MCHYYLLILAFQRYVATEVQVYVTIINANVMPYFNTDYLSGALTDAFRNHFHLLLLFSVVENSSNCFNMRLHT